MRVDIHKNSVLEVPATFEDVASVKIRDADGGLVAVALQHGPAVVMVVAGDPEFSSFCEQYGIKMSPVKTVGSR